MKTNKKIGLALSGGGYRAAAFHLGTLKKLNKMGLLEKVDVISTISGGSIIGAFYCYCNKPFNEFEIDMYNSLYRKSVIGYVLRSLTFITAAFLFLIFISICFIISKYASGWLLIPFLLLSIFITGRFQFRIFPVSKEIENAYNKFYFNGATFSELKDKPELAIGTTNLQSFRPFTFSKRKMEDSSYAYMTPPIKFKNEKFPLARAVAASSCVPNFFTPVKIDIAFFDDHNDFNRVSPVLVDGGIYDNQGIQKLTQAKSSYECDIIITSDAGNKLPFDGAYNNTFILLMRTVEAFMARIKNFQMMQNLYGNTTTNKEVAYLSLGWDVQNCIGGFINNLKTGNIAPHIIEAHKIPAEYLKDIKTYESKIVDILKINTNYDVILSNNLSDQEATIARRVTTNLTALKKSQLDALIKHASNLTELQVKLYCPTLLQNI